MLLVIQVVASEGLENQREENVSSMVMESVMVMEAVAIGGIVPVLLAGGREEYQDLKKNLLPAHTSIFGKVVQVHLLVHC